METVTYDKTELRRIKGAFKAMDEEALNQAKVESSALAEYLKSEIQSAGYGRTKAAIGVQRLVDGARVSKSSKIGEISYGFAGQRFSGGATTQILWPGLEFGSNRFKQFPSRTPAQKRGNKGYFIYPTLRRLQPELIAKWENAFSKIVGKWDD